MELNNWPFYSNAARVNERKEAPEPESGSKNGCRTGDTRSILLISTLNNLSRAVEASAPQWVEVGEFSEQVSRTSGPGWSIKAASSCIGFG